MKIEITDKTIMTAALKKTEEEDFFEALCLFGRVDSYESMLNQIGCLCMMEDYGYSVELYRKLIARFGGTHNCVADVRRLGDSTENLINYYGNGLKGIYARRDENKISADEKLLGSYNWNNDDDSDFFDQYTESEEINFAALLGEDSAHNSRFFEVGSDDYCRNLGSRMLSAYIKGNAKEAYNLHKELLSVESYSADVLEMQILLCFTLRQWERGTELSVRVADCPDVSYRCLEMAIQILGFQNVHTDILEKLMLRILEKEDEISGSMLMNFIRIAAVCLGYGEITLAFTDILYSRCDEAGASAINLCARVYYNCKQQQSAREAALLLTQMAPWDGIAKCLLDYFDSGNYIPLSDPLPFTDMLLRYDIPTGLCTVAETKLHYLLKENDGLLPSENISFLDCIAKVCDTYVIKGEVKKFSIHCNELDSLLKKLKPQDPDVFFNFVKDRLCNILPNVALNAQFLATLLRLGFRKSVFIALPSEEFYLLDLSGLPAEAEDGFDECFGICATLRKVSANRMLSVYRKIISRTAEAKNATARQIAFAMLAVNYKDFVASDKNGYFDDTDREFYNNFFAEF